MSHTRVLAITLLVSGSAGLHAAGPRYKEITSRMLLSQTAGFPNFRSMNRDPKLNINFDPA
jgi:CubicO group peptidase (beta-lactamase class C family)